MPPQNTPAKNAPAQTRSAPSAAAGNLTAHRPPPTQARSPPDRSRRLPKAAPKRTLSPCRPLSLRPRRRPGPERMRGPGHPQMTADAILPGRRRLRGKAPCSDVGLDGRTTRRHHGDLPKLHRRSATPGPAHLDELMASGSREFSPSSIWDYLGRAGERQPHGEGPRRCSR